MPIGSNYTRELETLQEECRACGRNADEVRLIAVSKTVEIAAIDDAIKAGAVDLAENRPDRIVQAHETYPQVNWHFIGNVQSRRIPDIVASSVLIHSVYQMKHLDKIDASARALGKVQEVLIEVNVSGEESKSGAHPQDARDLILHTINLDNVRVVGLMTMAPRGDEAVAKQTFADLAALRDTLNADESIIAGNIHISELSMGMSEDWRLAVASGATMIRIGRAIFSDDFA